MSNEYLEYIKKHRLDFIKLTEKQNFELAKLYIKTAEIIKAQAESIIDKEGLSYAAAKIRVKSLLIEAGRLTDGFKGILNKSLIDAAGLGTEADKIMMSKYQSSLADSGIKVDFNRILQKVNPEAVAAVFDRIWTDGLKLSDRVWLLERRTKQEIERIVLQNVISGGSASNKATLSALENLLNPGYTPAKLTSLHGRKVGYEASRLLRTSMSEAFNEGARLSNLKNPGSTGMKLLNASGPCEVCAALDLLPVEQTGLPPIHPNCRCTTLEDVQSVEDFTDRYIKFMDDPSSDKQLGDWVLNVYDKGGAKTLTSIPAVKDVVNKTGSNAKTVKEAEDWAKKNLGIKAIDYSKTDVLMANEINDTISTLSKKYGITLDSIQPYKTGTRMMGESVKKGSEDRIFFQVAGTANVNTGEKFAMFKYSESTASSINVAEETIKKLAEQGLIKNTNITEAITHEFGHLVDLTKSGLYRSPADDLMDLIYKSFEGDNTARYFFESAMRKEVGSYINSGAKETFAEVFRLYEAGKLPKELKFVESFMEGLK